MMMNHPLAMIDSSDDDEEVTGFKGAATTTTRLRVESPPSEASDRASKASDDGQASPAAAANGAQLDSQTLALANIIRSKCAAKRLAPPPPPPNAMMARSTTTALPSPRIERPFPPPSDDFLIPVEHVRWFYKTEKEKHSTSSSNTTVETTTAKDSNIPSFNDANNNNTIGSKITVV